MRRAAWGKKYSAGAILTIDLDAWQNTPDFLGGIELRYLMSHLPCAESQDCSIGVIDADPNWIRPGASVDLISPEQTVDDVAALADTIGYEILTSLGGRYHCDYVGDNHSSN